MSTINLLFNIYLFRSAPLLASNYNVFQSFWQKIHDFFLAFSMGYFPESKTEVNLVRSCKILARFLQDVVKSYKILTRFLQDLTRLTFSDKILTRFLQDYFFLTRFLQD